MTPASAGDVLTRRGAPAGAAGLTAHVLDAAALQALDAAEWDRLSLAALTENPFYARQYVLGGIETVDRNAGLRALAIRNADGVLVGLFPYRMRLLPPFPWPVAEAATNRYQFSGLPLVAAAEAAPVIACWLDALAAGRVPRLWSFGHIDLDGAFKGILDRRCRQLGLTALAVAPYRRAHLTGVEGGFEAQCSTVIARSRLRDIQRNLRRLGEHGELSLERTSEPDLMRRRLEQFLAIEHTGWKGRRGTSFLSRADDAAFARLAFGGGAGREGLCIADSLLLDGEPIAVSLNIATGRTAFTPKVAYDERWRRYSPGMVLEYLVIERFYADGRFTDMDSATTVDGHAVLGLWNAHKTMGRLVVGPAGWRTRTLASGWERALTLKQAIKRRLPGRRRDDG